MKYIYKILLLLALFSLSLSADYEYTCTAEYMQFNDDKKLYQVPNTLQELYITFIHDELDIVKFRTKKESTYFNFEGILPPSTGGIVYSADNGNKLVFDNNHKMVFITYRGDIAQYSCPKIKISTRQIKK